MRGLAQSLELFLEATPDAIDYRSLDLVKEYTKLNAMLFDGKLGIYPMKFNKRKGLGGFVKWTPVRNAQGNITPKIKSIEISTFFVGTYQDFLNVLAHEMIHVYMLEKGDSYSVRDSHQHSFLFQAEMRRINSLGKGFNIDIKMDVTSSEVHDTGKKYGVIIVTPKAQKQGIIVTKEKNLALIFNELTQYPAEFRDRYEFDFYYSADPNLGRYPTVASVLKKRHFSWYGVSPEEIEKIRKEGHNYGSIRGAVVIRPK